MADYTQIIRDLSSDKFMEIFSASARKAREVYFARHAIKLPKKGPKVRKPGAKNALRAQALPQGRRRGRHEGAGEEDREQRAV